MVGFGAVRLTAEGIYNKNSTEEETDEVVGFGAVRLTAEGIYNIELFKLILYGTVRWQKK